MVGHSEYDFGGESTIVTGSTSGIGRGIAQVLAAADANVVVNSRTEADVRETASHLDNLGTGEIVGVPADLSDASAIDDLVESAIASFDEIDLLVNNAAVWPMETEMIAADLEDWD